MKRDTTQTIWRTVVFAGAMLGAPACTKSKPTTTTPGNTAAAPSDPAKMQQIAKPASADAPANPCGGDPNPCGGEPTPRPRGADNDGGGGIGRGFILS